MSNWPQTMPRLLDARERAERDARRRTVRIIIVMAVFYAAVAVFAMMAVRYGRGIGP